MNKNLKQTLSGGALLFLFIGVYNIFTGYFDSGKIALTNWDAKQILPDLIFVCFVSFIYYKKHED